MSDRALENAKLRRDEIASMINKTLQQVDEWKRELVSVDRFIEQWHAFALSKNVDSRTYTEQESTHSMSVVSEGATISAESQSAKRPRHNSKKEDVAAAAREILLQHGIPLSRTDLFRALIEKGLIIEGTDPEMVLSTMLWRMRKQIARVKSGGYWPADIANADAGYDPQTASDIETAFNTPLDEARELSEDDKARLLADGVELTVGTGRSGRILDLL